MKIEKDNYILFLECCKMIAWDLKHFDPATPDQALPFRHTSSRLRSMLKPLGNIFRGHTSGMETFL